MHGCRQTVALVIVAGLVTAMSHPRAWAPQRPQDTTGADSLVFHQLEVRPADTIAQPGLVPVSITESRDRLYLHRDVLVTHFDVQRVTVTDRDSGVACLRS
jgi:hypothetical protein